MNVSEVMTTDVNSCTPESSLEEVAQKMKEIEVGVVPVCDQGKLKGLVTDRDIVVKGLAEQLPSNAKVSEVMTTEQITGTQDMSVEEAARLMSDHQIRRLPIMENDKLVGIVSLGDLAVEHPSNDKIGRVLEEVSHPAKPNQ
ncbi:CBS domain-containing protein [Salinithrix halophila]|uniref:CBS domain-containing protein n=1 Tax=Salinithrix halophila TaxID=1485204 RepID=A0ABV8JEL9_9BACL